MKELEYPFDSEYILKKSKAIRRQLLADGTSRTHKRIAVLGGSTTHDYIRILELFLLNYGIEPEFYESEYAGYYQDAMFDPEELISFGPDLIYIHTGYRNIENLPSPGMSHDDVNAMLDAEFGRFKGMWEHLAARYQCPVIQNNFEYPFYRIMGNYEAVDPSGRVRYVNRLNELFADYAAGHEAFYIHDINYLSAAYGLDKWIDPAFWNMYKYMCSIQAIPEFAFSLSHIIKAVWGRNKKALALDLDNTLWGGIVGDDGPENLEIGQETAVAETYTEFQTYLKEQKSIGVLLNVDSKNDEANAMAGLEHPDGVLRPDDFIEIRANWDPKDRNLTDIASAINILPDSFVFIDDNPAERMIVEEQVPGVSVPDIGQPEEYIRRIDKNGYFEVIGLSDDDKQRNTMYKANAERAHMQAAYSDYHEYLLGLQMTAHIAPFEPLYYNRISQLTNKSNQFNLTTLRCTVADIERYASDDGYITLYGQLSDKFGDNGIVSLVMGEIDPDAQALHIRLWLMSCRVLKRDMECAMLDAVVDAARAHGLKTVYGYYFPTAKNGMVREFYRSMGFTEVDEEETNRKLAGASAWSGAETAAGSTVWSLDINSAESPRNTVIGINT